MFNFFLYNSSSLIDCNSKFKGIKCVQETLAHFQFDFERNRIHYLYKNIFKENSMMLDINGVRESKENKHLITILFINKNYPIFIHSKIYSIMKL